MPYASTMKPIKVQRKRMRASPAKKAAVPLAFCFRAKKRRVFWGPIMMVRPMRNRIWAGSSMLDRGGQRWGGGDNTGAYVSHSKPKRKKRLLAVAITLERVPARLDSHGTIKEEHDTSNEEETTYNMAKTRPPVSPPRSLLLSVFSSRSQDYIPPEQNTTPISTPTVSNERGKRKQEHGKGASLAFSVAPLAYSLLWVSDNHIDDMLSGIVLRKGIEE